MLSVFLPSPSLPPTSSLLHLLSFLIPLPSSRLLLCLPLNILVTQLRILLRRLPLIYHIRHPKKRQKSAVLLPAACCLLPAAEVCSRSWIAEAALASHGALRLAAM